jgi:hypothetical protein
MAKSSIAERMGNSGWRCLQTDPPPADMRMFFVGHATGGRMDLVFRWPWNGRQWYWVEGPTENYPLDDYGPNVWYPGPPLIPGSNVEAIQKGKLP